MRRTTLTIRPVPAAGLAAAAAILTGLAVARARPSAPAAALPRPSAEPAHPLDLEGLRAAGW